VRWLDSVHLLIRYYNYRMAQLEKSNRWCVEAKLAVKIICEPITPDNACWSAIGSWKVPVQRNRVSRKSGPSAVSVPVASLRKAHISGTWAASLIPKKARSPRRSAAGAVAERAGVKCDEPFPPQMNRPNRRGYEMMLPISDVLDRHLSCFAECDGGGWPTTRPM
jgi:hypothetical protein